MMFVNTVSTEERRLGKKSSKSRTYQSKKVTKKIMSESFNPEQRFPLSDNVITENRTESELPFTQHSSRYFSP